MGSVLGCGLPSFLGNVKKNSNGLSSSHVCAQEHVCVHWNMLPQVGQTDMVGGGGGGKERRKEKRKRKRKKWRKEKEENKRRRKRRNSLMQRNKMEG